MIPTNKSIGINTFSLTAVGSNLKYSNYVKHCVRADAGVPMPSDRVMPVVR